MKHQNKTDNMGGEIFSTVGYTKFKATLDNLVDALKGIHDKDTAKEQMAARIYEKLVVREFYAEDGPTDNDSLAEVARTAAEDFYGK